MRRKPGRATVMLAMLLCGTPILDAQSGAKNGEWRTYGDDVDKATGNEVGNVFMPAPQTGSPMTYMLSGKQYLVTAISGAGFPAELIAYNVPSAP